jgi:phosphoribosylanthranilate isomerase
MVRIKICGITREKDVEILNRYLPDYAGFIFAESRRRLTPEAAGRLSGMLADPIRKAGVFVNAAQEDLLAAVAAAGLDAVQLHGDETPEYVERLKCRLKPGIEVWKGIRVKDANAVNVLGAYTADRYLLDAYAEGSYGGGGRSFDWKYAEAAGAYGCIILAGGLNPANVAEAIRAVRPFAVDVSSGVESAGGGKDETKIREFINAVKEVEALK